MATPEQIETLTSDFLETDEVADYFAFVDTVRAAVEKGAAEVTVPTAFLARVIDGIQPLDFVHLREVHNRVCDSHGLPEEKKPVPQAREGGEKAF